jgi:hypothetical protein
MRSSIDDLMERYVPDSDDSDPREEQRRRWESERDAERLHRERSRRFRDKFENGSPSQGIRDELLTSNRNVGLSDILLDDSTLDHALRFATCDDSRSFDRVLLTDNKPLVIHALTRLIEH